MRNLISSACAVIIVSHDLASIEGLCDRVLWLDHGRIVSDGPAAEVIAAYHQVRQGPATVAGRLVLLRGNPSRPRADTSPKRKRGGATQRSAFVPPSLAPRASVLP